MTSNEEQRGIGSPNNASELLEMYFLEIRSNLLEAASGLDRIERAEGAKEAFDDPRSKKLLEALQLLQEMGACRAERFLELFSEPV